MPGYGRRPRLPPPPDAAEAQKPPVRSFRLRKRPVPIPEQGNMVIRALIRARLLGMQLLTIEARVVVGADDDYRPVTLPVVLSPYKPSELDQQSARSGRVTSDSEARFARAIELLDQGIDALERSRRHG